jgi:hypothetical protein
VIREVWLTPFSRFRERDNCSGCEHTANGAVAGAPVTLTCVPTGGTSSRADAGERGVRGKEFGFSRENVTSRRCGRSLTINDKCVKQRRVKRIQRILFPWTKVPRSSHQRERSHAASHAIVKH